jgi:hypothetical protein
MHTSMEALGKLFGSVARVKLMKLFLFNEEESITKADAAKRAKVTPQAATRELGVLERSGMIRKKSFFKEGKKLQSGKKGKKRRVQGYVLNQNFRYLIPLQSMLMHSAPMQQKEITEKLSRIGKVKVIVVAGIFIQDPESRIDILVAGDDISSTKLRNAITSMEAEIGRELRYAIFDTPDFKYRMGVCDRLVRDVFDYPHEIVVDRIGLA